MKWPLIIRRVVGHSMEPTLKQGTVIFATPLFGFKRGDVVVAHVEDKEIIKRIESIQPNGYLLTGDNLAHSRDSRKFGVVEKSELLGKVIPHPQSKTYRKYKKHHKKTQNK